MKISSNSFKICIGLFLLNLIFTTPCFADYYNEGVYAFNQSDYSNAEKFFGKALYSHPNNKTIRYYYAISLFNNKKFDKAKMQYFFIISHYPNTEESQKSQQVLNYLAYSAKHNNGSKKVVIDIINHDNIMVVKNVLFNDTSSCNLILDTGASMTVISLDMANKLGLDLSNAPMVKIATANGFVNSPKIKVKSIEINGLVAENVDVLVQNIDTSYNTSGLLGLSFLDNFKVTIDRKSGKLFLERN